MESQKVLLTNSFYPPYHLGGDAIHVQQLAKLLAKEGHEVYVAFSIDAYSVKRFKSKKISVRSIEEDEMVTTYPLRSPLSFFEPIRSYTIGYSNWITKKLYKIMKRVKPDIIHHHNYSLLGNKIFELNRLVDISLLTLHDYYPICQQNELFKFGRKICDNPECFKCSFFIHRPYQLWRHTSMNNSFLNNDFIISPSQFLRNVIIKRSKFGKIVQEKFRVLPNFLNPINKELKEYNFDYGEYFVFSGKIIYIKGIHKLLKSFVQFSKEFPNVNLVVIGTGNLFKRLKKNVEKKKINNEIIFLGRTDYIKNLHIIKSAKGLILPSIWTENCPMTLIESIFLKTIPIATNLGGMQEIVSNLDESLLINPNNFETSLSRIMTSVITGEIKIPDSVFKRIFLHNYSPTVYLEKYYRLLNQKT